MLKQLLEKDLYRLLFLLISADILFMFVHVLHSIDSLTLFSSYYFSIGEDRALAETFVYVQEFWLIVSFFLLAFKKNRFVYIVWGIFFIYILLDDSLSIHESIAIFFAENIQFPEIAGINGISFGELIVVGLLGIIFFPLFGFAYYRGGTISRLHMKYFIYLLGMLVFFGVGVDLVHMILHNIMPGPVEGLVGLIEDGGEMLVISLMAWAAFCLYNQEEIELFSIFPYTN